VPDLSGQRIDRYHLIEKLGEGGMAIVYKALDTRLECEVAVKVIRTDNLPRNAEERALKRFEREAKSVAKLTHANIVKVTDYGDFEGSPYLVMEYLPGGTLKDFINLRGQIPWKEAVKLLIPIAEALAYAHSHNVIHRDVKPSNILLTENNSPMLTDFGVAKVIEEDLTMDLTGTNATVGTPEYMAPEQVLSKTVDHRVDIYALGIVFFEMLTGTKPFTADTPMAIILKQASEPLPLVTLFTESIPMAVEEILRISTDKKPGNRYADFNSMVEALKKIESDKAPTKFYKPHKENTKSDYSTCVNEPLDEISDEKIKIKDQKNSTIEFESSTLYKGNSCAFCVGFSPESELLAVGFSDRTIKLWGLRDKKLMNVFEGANGDVLSIKFNHEGTKLAAGSADNYIYEWKIDSKKPDRVFSGHLKPVRSIDYSADLKYLISCSDDRSIILWNLNTGSRQKKYSGHEGSINAVIFNQFSTGFYSGGEDRVLMCWDINKPNPTHVLNEHGSSILAITSDGALPVFATSSLDNIVKLWRFDNNKPFRVLQHSEPVYSLAFRPGHNQVATGSSDTQIRIWDTTNGHLLTTLRGHNYTVYGLAFNKNGSILASCSRDGKVLLWNEI
jgi:serine/threonine protein kinase